MRTARRTVRTIGQLNLTSSNATNCPPGYHWEAPGPIMGLEGLDLGALSACVPNAAPAPAKKVIPLTLGVKASAPAPAPAPAKKVIPLTLGVKASAPVQTSDAAPAPAPTTATDEPPAVDTAPACNCWPWWWMLAAAAVAAAAGYQLTGKGSRKRRRNAAEYVLRQVNPLALLG